ncbi:MAG: PD-(D/E)XK nuclease family protein [Pseudomonadota bacterium]
MNNHNIYNSEVVQDNTLEIISNHLLQASRNLSAVRSKNIATLFFNVDKMLDERQLSLKNSIIELLKKARPHINRIINEIQENAPYFSVFQALGVSRKEVIQSRFLAYLLSPLESHNQGSLFLNALLAQLEVPKVVEENFKNICVSREHPAGDKRRMDIVIKFPHKWIIVIENKIDARESVEQLSIYRQWLDKQTCCADESKFLIFLTPTGHESVTCEIGSCCQLSYSDIANLFAVVLDDIKQESVRTVIRQYVSICRSIGGVNMNKQDKDLQDLLTQTENIRAAIEIEQQVMILRTNVAKSFAENIVDIIQKERIAPSDEIKSKWRAFSAIWPNGICFVDIRTIRHKFNSNYRLLGEHIFTDSNKGWYGWYRPNKIDWKSIQEHETYTLTKTMINDGYLEGAEDWWIGSEKLRGGRQGYVLSDADDIISCLNDNRSDKHPLAREIADEMWIMFNNYREKIEALDSFKSIV